MNSPELLGVSMVARDFLERRGYQGDGSDAIWRKGAKSVAVPVAMTSDEAEKIVASIALAEGMKQGDVIDELQAISNSLYAAGDGGAWSADDPWGERSKAQRDEQVKASSNMRVDLLLDRIEGRRG